MRRLLPFLASTLLCAGCMAKTLQNDTLRQIASMDDYRAESALNCLAVVAHEPGNLPPFALLADGITQEQDTGVLSAINLFARNGFGNASQSISATVARNPKVQWTIASVADYTQLQAMRCACQWAVYGPEVACANCGGILSDPQTDPSPGPHFGVANRLARIPPGWLHHGNQRPPHNAFYKARYSDTWVWVLPEDIDKLNEFILVLLDIGTLNLSAPLLNPTDNPPVLVTLQWRQKPQQYYEFQRNREYFDETGLLTEKQLRALLCEYPTPVTTKTEDEIVNELKKLFVIDKDERREFIEWARSLNYRFPDYWWVRRRFPDYSRASKFTSLISERQYYDLQFKTKDWKVNRDREPKRAEEFDNEFKRLLNEVLNPGTVAKKIAEIAGLAGDFDIRLASYEDLFGKVGLTARQFALLNCDSLKPFYGYNDKFKSRVCSILCNRDELTLDEQYLTDTQLNELVSLTYARPTFDLKKATNLVDLGLLPQEIRKLKEFKPPKKGPYLASTESYYGTEEEYMVILYFAIYEYDEKKFLDKSGFFDDDRFQKAFFDNYLYDPKATQYALNNPRSQILTKVAQAAKVPTPQSKELVFEDYRVIKPEFVEYINMRLHQAKPPEGAFITLEEWRAMSTPYHGPRASIKPDGTVTQPTGLPARPPALVPPPIRESEPSRPAPIRPSKDELNRLKIND
jgi:hypothetical protein